MKKLLILVLLLSGCSTFTLDKLHTEGAKASGFCIKGGYAMAGGEIVGAKVNDDFIGVVAIAPDCSVSIQSFPRSPLPTPGLVF